MGTTIKPDPVSFIGGHVLLLLVGGLAVSALLAFTLTPLLPYFLLMLAVLTVGRFVAFKKEEYIFETGKIVRNFGWLFTQHSAELAYTNITHVKETRPWIQTLLFGTGQVQIESAGSGLTEIRLSHIRQSPQLYQKVIKIMQKHGFRLTQNKLLQTHRPALIGVFINVLQGFIVSFGVFALLFIETDRNLVPVQYLLWIIAIAFFVLGMRAVFQFLDLYYRKYYTFEDTVRYTEGFLTKRDAIIPVENMTDVVVNQNLIQRIFDITRVQISCQGAGGEITFENIKGGKGLVATLSGLIKKYHHVTKKRSSEQTYRMQKLRGLFWMLLAFIPCLVLILPLIWWIPAFIRKFIHLSNTTFFLSSDELTMEYRFLDISRITFTLDRITGISISESIMDRMFGTYTLVVWSLGAQEEMRIPYIKEDELRKTLLEQINVVPVSGMKRIDSAFSLMSYLTRHLYLSCFIISLVFSFIFISVVMTNAITIAGTFIVLFCAALHFAFSATYYDGAHITYNNRKLFVEKGNAIYHLRQYAFFSQVKGLTMIAYPFSDKATLHIDIAGEHMITSGTNNLQLASNSFTMPYMDERITLIKTDDTPLQSYGVHLPIVLVRMFLAFPIFPIVIAYLRSIRYIITKTHVETQSGIIYRKRQFILYTSIDHIQYGQGALQKAFKVGTVSVYTTGSSGSEMDLRDFSAYQTLHKKLITLYGRR